MTEAEEIKGKIAGYFALKDDIDTVILFGSFAKNAAGSNSDIDIAIHSAAPLGFEALASIQNDLALLCRREIDLADLSKAEGIFLCQIMTGGVKIKFSKNVFVRYLVKALCFKEDFLPTVEYMNKEKIRRFVNG